VPPEAWSDRSHCGRKIAGSQAGAAADDGEWAPVESTAGLTVSAVSEGSEPLGGPMNVDALDGAMPLHGVNRRTVGGSNHFGEMEWAVRPGSFIGRGCSPQL